MVACEAREHGHDSKQRHQVEGPIMQAKEWMREFGRCNLWSARAQKSQREDHHPGENRAREGHVTTQAGRPRPASLPYKCNPGVLLWQASNSSISLIVCLKF
jgi:hypothetical protein